MIEDLFYSVVICYANSAIILPCVRNLMPKTDFQNGKSYSPDNRFLEAFFFVKKELVSENVVSHSASYTSQIAWRYF